MKKILYFITLLNMGLGWDGLMAETAVQPAPPAQQSSAEDNQMQGWMVESLAVAKDYVDGLDREEYAQSWAKGDQLFQHIITKEEWTRALNASRKHLGKVKSRTLKDQRPAKDPHGLPRGAYMVVEYNTSFENAPASGELLTLRRGSDGKWRIVTYQVN